MLSQTLLTKCMCVWREVWGATNKFFKNIQWRSDGCFSVNIIVVVVVCISRCCFYWIFFFFFLLLLLVFLLRENSSTHTPKIYQPSCCYLLARSNNEKFLGNRPTVRYNSNDLSWCIGIRLELSCAIIEYYLSFC